MEFYNLISSVFLVLYVRLCAVRDSLIKVLLLRIIFKYFAQELYFQWLIAFSGLMYFNFSYAYILLRAFILFIAYMCFLGQL